MALRDQPYIPLYVQDFLTDEKLMECSASATGIYIRIMCIMHKSDEYGMILLKQKDKQSSKQVENFAFKLAKYLPYDFEEIKNGLIELINEGVLQISDDILSQKRMIRDNEISIIRSGAGKKGGLKTQFAKANAKANVKAKPQANSEYENEYENDISVLGSIEDRVKYYWEKWKNYKKSEFNFSYNSLEAEDTSKRELLKLADNNLDIVIDTIEYSIGQGYKGFVKRKTAQNGNKGKSGTTREEREIIVAEALGIISSDNIKH